MAVELSLSVRVTVGNLILYSILSFKGFHSSSLPVSGVNGVKCTSF